MNEARTENIARLPLIVIGGPTASGKSDLAVELSLRLHGSVISADSMQVYRGMDIGSAKVTEEEMRGVPHALIDIADPEDEWNVFLFQKKASAAIEAAHREGLLPFVTGGTGFYIRALLYGTQFTETETDTTYREACYERATLPPPRRSTRTTSSASCAHWSTSTRPASGSPSTTGRSGRVPRSTTTCTSR